MARVPCGPPLNRTAAGSEAPVSVRSAPAGELDRRARRRQLALEVERLQHGHRDVLGRGDGARLPSAARLDRAQARRRELDVVERRTLGQQHGRVVGAGVEVHDAGIDPAPVRRGGHGEAAQHGLVADPLDLGLGRPRAGDLQAEAVVAGSRDAERVDGLADAADRADRVVGRRLDARAAHVAVGAEQTAVAAGERRERLRGRVVDARLVAEDGEAAENEARPLGVGDGGGRGCVAVERQERGQSHGCREPHGLGAHPSSSPARGCRCV